MTLNQINILSKKIVTEILNDLTDRGGLQNAWDDIDEEIQDEIKAEWIAIVKKNIPVRKDEKISNNPPNQSTR